MQITIEKRFNPQGKGPIAVVDTDGVKYKFWSTVDKKPNPIANIIQKGGTYEVETEEVTSGGYTDLFITKAKVVGSQPAQQSSGGSTSENSGNAGSSTHRDYLIVSQVATKGAIDLACAGQIKADEIGKWAGKIAGVIYNLTTLSDLGQLENDPFAD